MTINDRIRKIRQNKNMNQSAFAETIGIGQAGLSAIEKGIRGVTERNILAICEKFSINQHWLRTGEGEMFVRQFDDEIEQLAVKYNLSSLEKALISEYAKLNKEHREMFQSYLKNVFNGMTEQAADTEPEEPDNPWKTETDRMQAALDRQKAMDDNYNKPSKKEKLSS